MKNRRQILSTRPLDETLIGEAKQAGLDIDELSFIETEPIQTLAIQQEIKQAFLKPATVVFTSMNAVEAVAPYQEHVEPSWKIYCMGNTTKNLVEKYFGKEKIAGTANNASSLAEKIAADRFTDNVLFFCGDQRRDELPSILASNQINVHEMEVYQTIAVPHTINKVYHGILFFSPSAVASFFQKNKLTAATILFAIGNTTATEIKKFTNNKIVTGDDPGKEQLVRKMIAYFEGNGEW